MAEIIIDTYLCSGCETCTEMCPDVFCIDEATEKAALVRSLPKLPTLFGRQRLFARKNVLKF